MRMNHVLALAGVAAALCLGASQGLAQQDNNQGGGRGGRGQGQGGGRGNFDPAQFQQRMMERTKEMLEVNDDAEWKAIEPLVQKVMDVRREQFGGMGRGMFGRGRGGNGGPGGGGPGGGGPGGGGGGGFGGQPNPDADALQKAIDAKASNSEMKAAIAKYQDARKAKQAQLEKAQADLRKVLSVRQEAIATLNGLL